MSVIFSRQCEYALQAVLYLALKKNGEMTSSKELTKRLGIPYHFLSKILQDLTNKKLLVSQKGPNGGFGLGMPAGDITLFHIVEAIDGIDFTNTCVLGFPECSSKNPCSVHETWGGLRESIYNMLVKKSIARIAQEMGRPEYKMSSD